jgi:hypothetical protein
MASEEAWLGTDIDCIEGGCVMVAIHVKFAVHCPSLMAVASTQTFCWSKEYCLLQCLRSEYVYSLIMSYSYLIKEIMDKNKSMSYRNRTEFGRR